MYILSQVLVVIADLLFVFSMLSKKKIGIVLFLCISNVFYAVHFLLLENGLTGSIIIFLDIIFLVVLYALEKTNKTKYSKIVVVITIVLTVVISILTWGGLISLLPMFAMLIYLTGMIFTNVVYVKSGALIRNILNIIYLFLLASYVGAILELALMISAIIGIIISIKQSKNTSPEINNV